MNAKLASSALMGLMAVIANQSLGGATAVLFMTPIWAGFFLLAWNPQWIRKSK